MEDSNFVLGSLYNDLDSDDAIEVTVATYCQLEKKKKPVREQRLTSKAIGKRSYPFEFVQRELKNLEKNVCKLEIKSNEALSGGRLTIESPVWLSNKIVSIGLPIDKNLNAGLLITLFAPHNLQSRVNYYRPEPMLKKLARITVVVHEEAIVPNKKELITLAVGTGTPVVTVINEMQIVNTTMYQSRLLIDAAT